MFKCSNFLCAEHKDLVSYRLTNDESQDKSSNLTCKDGDTVEVEGKRLTKLGKCRSRISKVDASLDYGPDTDADQPGQGPSSSREEKVSSLKTVSTTSLSFGA